MIRTLFDDDNDETAEIDQRAVYRLAAQRDLIQRCLSDGPTTTDAVQAAVEVPSGVHPNNLGLAINRLVQIGLIRMAGVAQTTRPQGTGRLLREWEISDRQAALNWLANASPETAVGS